MHWNQFRDEGSDWKPKLWTLSHLRLKLKTFDSIPDRSLENYLDWYSWGFGAATNFHDPDSPLCIPKVKERRSLESQVSRSKTKYSAVSFENCKRLKIELSMSSSSYSIFILNFFHFLLNFLASARIETRVNLLYWRILRHYTNDWCEFDLKMTYP